MPTRACSVETTLGPNWKLAPPPVIEKLTVEPDATLELSEKLRFSVEELREAVSPLPLACSPLIVATMSVPAARVAAAAPTPTVLVANEPLIALADTKAAEP